MPLLLCKMVISGQPEPVQLPVEEPEDPAAAAEELRKSWTIPLMMCAPGCPEVASLGVRFELFRANGQKSKWAREQQSSDTKLKQVFNDMDDMAAGEDVSGRQLRLFLSLHDLLSRQTYPRPRLFPFR